MFCGAACRRWLLCKPLRRQAVVVAVVALCVAQVVAPGTSSAATDTFVGVGPRVQVDASRLPAPGSYRLPRIAGAPNSDVLDIAGRSARFHGLLRGRISVVSFMYSYCRDPQGCPRAWAVLDAVHAEFLRDE